VEVRERAAAIARQRALLRTQSAGAGAEHYLDVLERKPAWRIETLPRGGKERCLQITIDCSTADRGMESRVATRQMIQC